MSDTFNNGETTHLRRRVANLEANVKALSDEDDDKPVDIGEEPLSRILKLETDYRTLMDLYQLIVNKAINRGKRIDVLEAHITILNERIDVLDERINESNKRR